MRAVGGMWSHAGVRGKMCAAAGVSMTSGETCPETQPPPGTERSPSGGLPHIFSLSLVRSAPGRS